MKFKIIEESRFLKDEEMQKAKGGAYCTPSAPYESCIGSIYTTCKVENLGVSMFDQKPCGLPDTLYSVCLGEMTYRHCDLINYLVCGSGYKGTE